MLYYHVNPHNLIVFILAIKISGITEGYCIQISRSFALCSFYFRLPFCFSPQLVIDFRGFVAVSSIYFLWWLHSDYTNA
jgi:hypothetical protein